MPFLVGDYVVVKQASDTKEIMGRINSDSFDGEYLVEFPRTVDAQGNYQSGVHAWNFKSSQIRLANGKEIDQFLKEERRVEEAIACSQIRAKKEKAEREKKQKEEHKRTLQSAISTMDANQLWESVLYYRQLVELHNERLKSLLLTEKK